jgi:hypothetical protein
LPLGYKNAFCTGHEWLGRIEAGEFSQVYFARIHMPLNDVQNVQKEFLLLMDRLIQSEEAFIQYMIVEILHVLARSTESSVSVHENRYEHFFIG